MSKLLLFFCVSAILSLAIADNAICSQPKVVGPCRAAFQRWYYNSELAKCETFIYGGCQGNDNNFATYQQCSSACEPKILGADDSICSLEPKTGPCKAYFPRYFYNPENNQCQEFIYGGCLGNSNNFLDKTSCEKTCLKLRDQQAVCQLEPEVGVCRAHIQRYYFDANSGKCEIFFYGGCGGNGNNFADEQSCLNTCAD